MCSICGMIEWQHPESMDAAVLEEMGGRMKRRGPDRTDRLLGRFAMLHHNRLAVIDPENGHQPMTAQWQGRRCSIVYNGELYNSPELRAELSAQGVRFCTGCDTETVLYSYLVYGEQCVEKLNGIFAFAVYDEERRRAFFARDRLGVKPFFYTFVGSTLLFASEIKALLAHPLVTPAVSRKGLWELLYLTPVTLPGSGVFENIFELKPGWRGTFSEEGLAIAPYWELRPACCRDSAAQAAAHTRDLLCDAIRRQLVSDVPLCTFLSGGLDSSVITAVAAEEARLYGETLSTYSFEYEGNRQYFQHSLFQPQGDDDFAVFLAEFLGTDHTVLTAPTAEVARRLFDATTARDLPGQADIDSSLLYFCREVRREHTVALSGECADEIFGGYPWFYRPEMLERDFFPWIHDPNVRIGLFDEAVTHPKEGREWLTSVYRETVTDAAGTDEDSAEDRTARIATLLSTRYFMASLLERKDRMSMANGLEVRVPFADHRILEYVYNVPWNIKFENGVEKALLRNAMAEFLPDRILHRKKSPYPKTHHPDYFRAVRELLDRRLERNGALSGLLDRKALARITEAENVTWFGQLMATPQLIAWLVQFDFWMERYHVRFV